MPVVGGGKSSALGVVKHRGLLAGWLSRYHVLEVLTEVLESIFLCGNVARRLKLIQKTKVH